MRVVSFVRTIRTGAIHPECSCLQRTPDGLVHKKQYAVQCCLRHPSAVSMHPAAHPSAKELNSYQLNSICSDACTPHMGRPAQCSLADILLTHNSNLLHTVSLQPQRRSAVHQGHLAVDNRSTTNVAVAPQTWPWNCLYSDNTCSHQPSGRGTASV